MVWYSHLFQNFPQFIVIHTVKGFGIVNKPEVDVFLELSCFFHDPADVGNLISGSSAFSKTTLNIWKFMVHVPLKPVLRTLSTTLLACEMTTAEFSKFAGILSAALSQHHLLGFEIAQLECHCLH